jgi:hypothetical protein
LFCTVLNGLLSIFRESNGIWWTKEQLIANPHLAWTSAVTKIGIACVLAYLLTRW